MKKIFFLIAVNSMITLANAQTSKLPAELMFNGKPIDAICFDSHEETKINLQECGAKQRGIIPTGKNDYLTKKSYIGYDWKSEEDGMQGYTYYRYFPAGKNTFWIDTLNNGGGSGDFTMILRAKRDKDMITFESYTGGDRCNGGITDIHSKANTLTYSQNLGAFDFLSLAESNPHHLKPYDDLAACAVCCVAKAVYTLTPESKQPQFEYVDLKAYADNAKTESQGSKQACFNKVYLSYLKKNKTRLNEKELKEFVNAFNQTCF